MGKFKIPVIPSTTQKTIRFPNYLIEKVENMIIGKESNFSAFVIEAVRVVVDDLEKENYEKGQQEVEKMKEDTKMLKRDVLLELDKIKNLKF